MEDLLKDASIDLNIIAEPKTSSTPALKKRPKKKNKYERRRLRAKKARDSKNGVVAASPKKSRESGKKEKGNQEDEKDQIEHEQDHVDDAETAKDVTEQQQQQVKPVAFKALREMEKEVKEAEEDDIPDLEEDDQNSMNNDDDKKNSLPHDEEERAKYLAEFHARPMELDRRAGVVMRKVKASRESSHVFHSEMSGWEGIPLHSRLISALESHHFNLNRPTVIQTKAIPAFFAKQQEHNILLHSETGSGKTLAYLLPIVQSLAVERDGELRKMDRSKAGTRCIILCPTRELASQTMAVAERLCTNSFNWLVAGCLFGEEKRKSEKARIRKGLSIVVATPGRLLDHLTRTESLLMALKGKLEWLVLDEADRLLDMGLGEQVKQIVQRLRANQPGSGREGITWRSALVSATVTGQVEKLAKETLIGGDNSWEWVRGGKDVEAAVESELADSTPRQLTQMHITVSAKLRLSALIAFLLQRVKKGERTVVFMSTCAAVDYYHALFETMGSILANDEADDDDNDDGDADSGIFGKLCPIYKLHGNIPHGERQLTMRKFMKGAESKQEAAVLLATDVAARGLNLPDVDWTVQYDPPSEVSDYVHRAGRVARAGKAGHSLLFLLPSERPFLDILKKRGIKSMTGLSLASTLNEAAAISSKLTEDGVKRSGGGLGQADHKFASRAGEAFSSELQRRLEDCVQQDDERAKQEQKERLKKAKRKAAKPVFESGELMELARNAFISHIRAYPTKEKAVRHIFSAKALHLGHVARSFALREPPKKLVNSSKKGQTVKPEEERKRNSRMAFEHNNLDGDDDAALEPKRQKRSDDQHHFQKPTNPKEAREMLMANAARLQSNTMDHM